MKYLLLSFVLGLSFQANAQNASLIYKGIEYSNHFELYEKEVQRDINNTFSKIEVHLGKIRNSYKEIAKLKENINFNREEFEELEQEIKDLSTKEDAQDLSALEKKLKTFRLNNTLDNIQHDKHFLKAKLANISFHLIKIENEINILELNLNRKKLENSKAWEEFECAAKKHHGKYVLIWDDFIVLSRDSASELKQAITKHYPTAYEAFNCKDETLTFLDNLAFTARSFLNVLPGTFMPVAPMNWFSVDKDLEEQFDTEREEAMRINDLIDFYERQKVEAEKEIADTNLIIAE